MSSLIISFYLLYGHIIYTLYLPNRDWCKCNFNFNLLSYTQRLFLFLPVVQPAPHQCMSSGHVVIPASPGYLSSTVTQETQCGSPETPYLLRLNPGQHLNVTLLDFDVSSAVDGPRHVSGSLGDLSSPRDGQHSRGRSGNRQHSGCLRYGKKIYSAAPEHAIEKMINRASVALMVRLRIWCSTSVD